MQEGRQEQGHELRMRKLHVMSMYLLLHLAGAVVCLQG